MTFRKTANFRFRPHKNK